MKKHLLLFALLAAFFLPLASRAQTLADDYEFSTGVDATKWITLSSPSTVWSPGSYYDDAASGVLSIGFSFPFCGNNYTQFSVATNGWLRLGSAAAVSSTQAGMFNGSYYNQYLPKISGVTKDLSTGSNGYVRYAVTGTAPNRIFVCEFALAYSLSSSYNADVKWQVQLYETGKVALVYGPTTPTNTPSGFHTGLASDGTDVVVISPSTHQPIYSTGGGYSTTFSTWHGANRYYEFTPIVVTCPRPVSVANNNIDTASADLSWTPAGTETEWLFSCSGNGFDTSFNVYDTTVSLTGLTANTLYSASVRALCSTTDTSRARTISFRTICTPLVSLPYFMNFESATSGSSTTGSAFVNCWHRLNNGTSYGGYPYVNSSSTYNHTAGGSKGLYWYNSTTTGTYGDYQCIVFPAIDTTLYSISDLQLSMWAKVEGTSYNAAFQIGVMSNPDDITSFTQVGTVNINGNTAWTEYLTNFDNYYGDGRFVAIKANRGSSAWYAYVDDLKLSVAPDCPRVENIVASNPTTSTVDLRWTETGSATSWTVEYGPAGFTPGDTTGSIVYASDNNITLTGLSTNTAYDVYVTVDCGSDVGGVNSASFRTTCVSLDSLPYSQTFESASTGSSTTGSAFVNCWHRLNNGTTYGGWPYVSNSTTYNHTPGGSKGLYWYNSTTVGTYGDYECIILPSVDTDIYAINTLQLRFWAKASSSSYNPVFQVGVMSDPTNINTFAQVASVNVGSTTQWNEYLASLTSFTGSGSYVAIRAVRASGAWYAYVDDITLELAPACPDVCSIVPANVGISSAALAWNTRGGLETPSGYELEIVELDSVSTPTTYTSTSANYTFSGLTAGTSYKVRVRANCSTEDGSWDSITFSTMTLPCVALDPTTLDTVLFSNGTSTYSGTLVNSSWGNTECQFLFTAAELAAAGLTSGGIIGIDLGFSSSSSYNKEFSIYAGTTSRTSFSSASDMENPNDQTLVYGPTSHPTGTSGWQHYSFTEPFMWDGSSNLCFTTFMNQYGSSQSSSSFSGYYTSCSGNKNVYRYQDSNPFTLSNWSGGNPGSPNTYRPSIHFYTGGCAEYATCVEPLVMIDSTDPYNIYLSWAPGYQETSWDVEYRQGASGSWTSVESGTTNTNAVISSLTPATTYQVRVAALCSDSTAYTVTSVQTPCVAMPVPFTENFDSWGTGSASPAPACWYKYCNYNSYGTTYPYVSTSYAHSGNQSMYFYSYLNSSYMYLCLPLLQPAVDSLQVCFWAYRSSSYSCPIHVGVMDDPTDFATFTSVGTFNPVYGSGWTEFECALNTYMGSGRYIALAFPPNTSSSYPYVYLDDISVDYIPTCPRTTSVSTRHVTSNAATVYWTPTLNATEYEVEYGIHGFPQGYGTFLTSTDDSIQITGLYSTTQYDVYMRSVCGSGDTSWTRSTTFTTACGELLAAQLPYVMDFESQPTGSSSSTTWIPCWNRINNGTSYYGYPYVSASTTYNHTANGTKGLYWYNTTTTGSYGDYQVVVLPAVDTLELPVNTLQLKFWAKSSSTSYYPVFLVGVMTNPTNISTFTQVATVNVGGNTNWTEYSVEFDGYTGYGQYVAIRANRPSSSWYAYVDDITLRRAPTCFEPTALSLDYVDSATATVVWTPDSRTYPVGYQCEYGPQGFIQGTGYVTTVYDDSIQMTGLASNTAYSLYVRAICGADDTSYAVRFDFRTECDGLNTSDLPFNYGFEDATGTSSTSSINPCWKRLNNYTTNYPYPSSTTPHSGSKNLYFYSSSPYYSCLVMPAYNGGVNTLQMKFWSRASSANATGYGNMEVGVMTNPYDISTFQLIETTNNPTTTWARQTVVFSNYRGSGKYIAFRKPATSAGYTYLDDISIDLIPNCPEMRDMSVVNIMGTSAYATWNYQNGVVTTMPTFDLECIEVQTATPAVTLTGVTGLGQLLSGLTPNTQYKLRMRASCDAGEYGPWDSITFRTRCLAGGESTPSGTGTNQYSGVPVNSSWGNTVCQTVYTASELSSWGLTAGSIHGMKFTWTNNGSYTKQFTIFLNNTTATAATTTIAAPGTQYYTGVHAIGVSGEVEYTFTTPFQWDGTSNIMLTTFMNQAPGSSQSSSGFYGLSTDCGVTRTGYRYQDGTAWTTSNLTSGNTGSTNSYRPNVVFVTPCDSTVSCVSPNVVVDSFVNGDLYLSWAPGYLETSWDVDYRHADSTQWINDASGTTSTSHVIMGLPPDVPYQIRVGALCGDSTAYAVLNYRTPCTPAPVPFYENFDTWGTGSASPTPSCWYKYSSYSGYGTTYPYVSTSYAHSGSNSMYFYSYLYSSYMYLCLPLLAPPLDSLQISFWAYRASSYTCPIQVGVMSDPSDFSTFTSVGNYNPVYGNGWTPFECLLNNYHGNGQYIALAFPINTSSSYPYVYVDDIAVEYISSCPRVANVSASRITQTSARISWDTTAATQYEIEYGPAGYTQGSGTVLTSTDDTLTITGLHASSTYDVYVRGICTPDTGNWSFRYTFNTACGLIDSVPFFQNFNNIGTSTSVHAPHCWYGTSTYSTSYPYPSASYSRSGGGASMYMYLYNSSGYYTMLQLPQVDTTVLPMNNLQVEFSLLSSTTSYTHGVVVGVCTGQGMTGFVPVDTVVVSATVGTWQDFEIPLNNYTGNGSYITFMAYAGSSSYCYPYLDDIRLVNIPSCQRPDSLAASGATTSSVVASWHERGTATEWVIEYGPVGFTPGTGTSVSANSNPFTITGLPGSYNGEFYVRSVCSSTDTSRYSALACRFNTTQVPATLPYFCNYEDSTEWNNWQTHSNCSTGWFRGTADAYDGTHAMYISADNGATVGNGGHSYTVKASAYRDVDFGSIDSSFTFTFKSRIGGTLSARYDGVMVFLVDPTTPVVDQGTSILDSPWGNINVLYRIAFDYLDTAWHTISASFDTIHGVHRVAFYYFCQNTGSSYPYIGGPAEVDSITIDYSPCPRPLNLDTVRVGGSSATLTWTGSPSATYRVAYRVSGTSASTNIYLTTNTNSITITGLSSMTTYNAWVQKVCGSDSSLWSDGIAFKTLLCDGAQITYSFDSTMTASTSSYAPMGYSYYNYGYVQTIIDSAQLASLTGDITALAFHPADATSGNYYTNMDVYLANVPESDLSSGFILPDSNHVFVQVTNGANLSFSDTQWQPFGLDTAFTWDGHSNLLIAVNRRHGSYQSGASFYVHNTTSIKTRYLYNDGSPYSITSPGSGTSATYIGDFQLISCGGMVCPTPIVTGTTYDYESATATWTGDGSAYEVAIKQTVASAWPAEIAVTGNTYTFSGLLPATNYTYRVRQDCSADTLGFSGWVEVQFTTDSLPCFAPDSLTANVLDNTNVTLSWQRHAGATENAWNVHVWNTTDVDSVITVTGGVPTLSLTGFNAGATYSASVRALCGSQGIIEGDYGDTIQFTMATCPDVTNAVSTGHTFNSVTLDWNTTAPATSWLIEYGNYGFSQGTGTTVTATSHPYTVTGLADEQTYDFYIRAVCGTNWQSEHWSSRVRVTTSEAPTETFTVTAIPNNPQWGSVNGGGTYAPNDTVTLTATAASGYEFIEWNDHNTDNPRAFTVTCDTSFTAVFAAIPNYTITVMANNDEWGTVTGGGTFQRGTEIQISATANEGYHFDRWNDGSTDNPHTITVMADATYTANFVSDSAAMFTVTLTVNDETMGTVVGAGTYPEGSVVTIAALPNSGFHFVNWSDGNTEAARDLTITADVELMVTFEQNVGIDEVNGAATCTIYPNPAGNAATITVSGANGQLRIALLDLSGRTVASETLECGGDCEKRMDVENLAQGTYFVRITGEQVNLVKKLIVR